MSRIKQVLNERRLAYLGAAKTLNPEVDTLAAIGSEATTESLESPSAAHATAEQSLAEEVPAKVSA